MRITSPPSSTPPKAVLKGRQLADTIKQRSTLVGLVEPAGIVVGLATQPAYTLDALGSIASSVFSGNLGAAGGGVSDLVDTAVHPHGVGGIIYKSGLGLSAGINGLVGGMEIYQGVKNNDKPLALMGAADIASGAGSAALALGSPIVSLALSLSAAAGKTALVLARPKQFSRIQKAKTLFDAAGAVSSSVLKTGLATGPALVANAVIGPTQMLYMNSEGFRNKADKAIDWALHLFKKDDPD